MEAQLTLNLGAGRGDLPVSTLVPAEMTSLARSRIVFFDESTVLPCTHNLPPAERIGYSLGLILGTQLVVTGVNACCWIPS